MSSDGFDGSRIERVLHELRQKVEGEIPLVELLHTEFIRRHTRFQNFQEMVDRSPIEGGSVDEWWQGMKSVEWNRFVQETSSFPDWQTMLNTAARENILRRFKEGK